MIGRHMRALAAAALTMISVHQLAQAQAQAKTSRGGQGAALRHMQIHQVRELGLEIWAENQPPWDARLSTETGQPVFVVQSPDGYHPVTVMTYSAYPKQKVQDHLMQAMAIGAIRRGSQNFGLTEAQARSVSIAPASYGELQGYEGVFIGKANGELIDIQLFVGQAPNRYPVALTIYTQRDKLPNLVEQRRRAWANVSYLTQ